MNLRELASCVFSALGIPGESEGAIFGEVVRCLNAGETRVSNMLPNVEREKFATPYTVPAVIGTREYVTPVDFLDVVHITYDGYHCNRMALKDLSAIDRNTNYRPTKQRQQFFYETGSTQGRTKIGIIPTPTTTGNIIMTYFRKPVGFHDQGDGTGTVTAANNKTGAGAPTVASQASTTVFHDSNISFAAAQTVTSTTPDTGTSPASFGQTGFWNDANIRFRTGANAGQQRRVTTFKDYVSSAGQPTDGLTVVTGAPVSVASYGRFIVDTANAWYNIPAVGDEYEVCQVPIIPDQFHDLIYLWAAFLLSSKTKNDPKFFRDAFEQSAMQMGLKHTQNVEANMIGETPGGAR